MTPLVSILVPAFNSQEWIADTVRSAVAQTWPRKEIIIVDDGSTDDTLAVAMRFASKDVRVVAQRNQGAAAARNNAFSISQGDYIQWLDADDLLAPDKISRQMDALDTCRSRRTLLSSAWARFMYRPERAQFIPTELWSDLTPVEWLLRKMSLNLHMQTATWLVSRELTAAAGQWDTRLLSDDDGEYFCRVLLESDGTRFVPDSKVFYRWAGVHSLGYLGQSDRKLEAQFLAMSLHIQYLRSLEDSERVRWACTEYLRTWLIYFYPDRLDIVRKAEDLAAAFGNELGVPRLSWKYDWIRKLFGWRAAKHAWRSLPGLKHSLISSVDKALSQWEQRSVA